MHCAGQAVHCLRPEACSGQSSSVAAPACLWVSLWVCPSPLMTGCGEQGKHELCPVPLMTGCGEQGKQDLAVVLELAVTLLVASILCCRLRPLSLLH